MGLDWRSIRTSYTFTGFGDSLRRDSNEFGTLVVSFFLPMDCIEFWHEGGIGRKPFLSRPLQAQGICRAQNSFELDPSPFFQG